jgi:hypothetical protein
VNYFVGGGQLVNFVAVVEQDSWTGESWTDRGDPADALAAYLAAVGSDPAAALRRYETLRLRRATRLQAMSANNKTRFHLPDGPAQHERDDQLAAGSTGWSFDAIAWLYDHDAAMISTADRPA